MASDVNYCTLLVTAARSLIFVLLLKIQQITAIENEINYRTVHAPFVKFVGQLNTEISSQVMTAVTWTQAICN